MKVKMKVLAAGPDGIVQPGEIKDVTEKEADILIRGLYAEPIDTPQKDGEYSELKVDNSPGNGAGDTAGSEGLPEDRRDGKRQSAFKTNKGGKGGSGKLSK